MAMCASVCLRLAGLAILLTAVCADTAAQATFGWRAEEWQPCNEPCGYQMRTVSCWDNSTDTLVDKTPCPTDEIRPIATRDCPGCECSDAATVRKCNCNGHIPVGLDECQCDATFTGTFCEAMLCPATWTAEECECCPSGVVSQSGACCDTGNGPPSLDMYGECCYGHVDGCGICGGKGVVRASNGECCQEGQAIDGMGNCCPEGQLVDACGICDGWNNTCGTIIRLLIVVDPSVDRIVKDAVWMFISYKLLYPSERVKVGELEALDVTDVVPFAGVLEGGSDATTLSDDSKDFIFGRVTVELDPLAYSGAAGVPLVDLEMISSALANSSHADYAGLERVFLVSVMRTCGDGVCSPGEHPSDTNFDGPSIYGEVTYNSNGTHTSGMMSDSSMAGSGGTNSSTGAQTGAFSGTFERTNATRPPSCNADCAAACPVRAPQENTAATPMVCAGHGVCDTSTKTCQCYAGFDGPDCAMCAKGFMLSYGGFCVPHPDQEMCGIPDTSGNSTTTGKETNSTKSPNDGTPRGENQKKFSDWSNCTAPCGGGTQNRTWQCMDANGDMAAPAMAPHTIMRKLLAGGEQCIPPSDNALFQNCNMMPCETFQFVNSSWTPCSQDCGGGYKTRRLTCFSSYGYAVENSKCSCDDTDCTTFAECNTDDCEGPYLTFSTYSSCSVECGGGIKTRTAFCNHPNGTAAAESVCLEAVLQDEYQEVSCNTAPCKADTFIWKTGEWSSCSPSVCGGTRTREVMCRNAYTGVLDATNTACDGMKPDMEQSCEPCGFCEDPMLFEDCSGNGQCVNDECDCDEETPWGGAICDVNTTLCAPPGRLSPSGTCCASGLLSSTGACCEMDPTGPAPVLDGNGDCCSEGFFDACGVCGGSNIGIDIFGICCPADGIFDTQARCCASGRMDACGVCDGSGDGCKTNAVVDTATSLPARRRQLLQTSSPTLRTFFAGLLSYPEALVTAMGTLKDGDPSTTVANITLEATSGNTTAANAISSTEDITAAMELARADSSSTITITSSPMIMKIPDCGDDLCSPGEARTQGAALPPYDCETDCPIILGTCPSPGSSELGDPTRECGALGSCARASLTCICFAGYDGEACGHCAEGYREVGDTCEVILSLLVTPDPVIPDEPETPMEGDQDNRSETNVGLIAGLTVLCVAITGAAAGAGYAYKTGRIGRSNRPEQYGVETA